MIHPPRMGRQHRCTPVLLAVLQPPAILSRLMLLSKLIVRSKRLIRALNSSRASLSINWSQAHLILVASPLVICRKNTSRYRRFSYLYFCDRRASCPRFPNQAPAEALIIGDRINGRQLAWPGPIFGIATAQVTYLGPPRSTFSIQFPIRPWPVSLVKIRAPLWL